MLQHFWLGSMQAMSEDLSFVRVSNVVKQFGDFTAVNNLSLNISRGEFFALLGSSGCGKTTLLRMLAGFETPSSGSIEIDGLVVTNTPPYERPTNMVFQSYALFPHMTVERNIAFGLRQETHSSDEIRRRVIEALELVQMRQFAQRRPHQLSGGQRQRVALARAIAKKPKILLLDEPMAALDKNLREATQFELKRIHEELGITFVIVTHDQEEAMSLATRIGLMQAGQIVQIGAPNELYASPRNTFAASFFGSINLFEGQLVSASSHRMALQSSDAGQLFASNCAESAPPGTKAWLAIRPENLSFSEIGTSASGNQLSGVVSAAAFLGTATSYRVKLASGKELRILRPSSPTQQAALFPPGTNVALTFRPEDATILFN
jgi:putrescine transport system ATP-binding protein